MGLLILTFLTGSFFGCLLGILFTSINHINKINEYYDDGYRDGFIEGTKNNQKVG